METAQKITPSEGSVSFIVDYFKTIRDVLFRPTEFFSQMSLEGGSTKPLVFAIITHWIGVLGKASWKLLFENRPSGEVILGDYFTRLGAPASFNETFRAWFKSTSMVLVDPFFTAFWIFFTAFLIYVGVRIFVTPGENQAPQKIRFEPAIRILSYSMAASVFLVVPFFGGLIAFVWRLVALVKGLKTIYRVESGIAIVLALFPYLVLLGLILAALLFFISVFLALLGAWI